MLDRIEELFGLCRLRLQGPFGVEKGCTLAAIAPICKKGRQAPVHARSLGQLLRTPNVFSTRAESSTRAP